MNVRERAIDLGFDLVGIAPAGPAPHAAALTDWLASGFQAEMAWMGRNADRRCDPRQVVPGARSVIMAGFHYFVEDPPADLWNHPLRGRVARYAWGPDYHDQLLPRLRTLAAELETMVPGTRHRAYVDTGPLLERPWAAEAGLGFIGRHSLLIAPRAGSYFVLGGIITDVELDYDAPATHQGARQGVYDCGQCRRCLDICPTRAIRAPYVVDSNRCISYLTIEHKGHIPEALRGRMGNWIFGCDACQEICPWVRQYAQGRSDRFTAFDAQRFAPDLLELMTLDAAAFRERYRGTPLIRTKRRGLLRNAAIALGNAGDKSALPVLRRAVQDEEEMVRVHAAWAIQQIEEAEEKGIGYATCSRRRMCQ